MYLKFPLSQAPSWKTEFPIYRNFLQKMLNLTAPPKVHKRNIREIFYFSRLKKNNPSLISGGADIFLQESTAISFRSKSSSLVNKTVGKPRLNPCICMMFLTDLPSFCNTAKKTPAENLDPYEQIISLNGLYSSFLIPTSSFRMSLEDSHLEVQAWCYSEIKDASMFSS